MCSLIIHDANDPARGVIRWPTREVGLTFCHIHVQKGKTPVDVTSSAVFISPSGPAER